jgi:sugar lactone lactonase YvrE
MSTRAQATCMVRPIGATLMLGLSVLLISSCKSRSISVSPDSTGVVALSALPPASGEKEQPKEPIVLATLKTDESGSGPGDIAVDADAIYLTESDRSNINDEEPTQIIRVPIGGGNPRVLATRQHSGQSLVATPEALFWVVAGDTERNISDAVVKMALKGGRPTQVAKTYIFGDAPLAADRSNVYFSGYDSDKGTLIRLPLAGGKKTVLATVDGENIKLIAADSTSVYWTSGSSIMKVPLAGGAAMELAKTSGSGNVWGMASDGVHVYWTDMGSASTEKNDGSVKRVAVAGGPVETIADGLPFKPWGIAVDDIHVYWVINSDNDGSIMRMRKTTRASSVLVSRQKSPVHLALDSSYVYWCNAGNGVVAKVPK